MVSHHLNNPMKKQLILSCLCAALLASCSVFHKHADPLAFYDLKTQRLQSSLDISKQKERLHKRNILISDASAPSWLDNTAIHYRLEFHNSAQLHRYANSRWIASPTVMLTQKMRDQIAKSTGNPVIKNNNTAKAEYILHIDLLEFTQVFDTVQQSHGSIALRASLVRNGTRNLLAQNYFSVQVAAPTSDAKGAVSALSNASDELTDKLIEWMIAELPANTSH